MNVHNQDRQDFVMLSEAKHLCPAREMLSEAKHDRAGFGR